MNSENGLAAMQGRETDACAATDEALAYASVVSASAVHVMAGNTSGPPNGVFFVKTWLHLR